MKKLFIRFFLLICSIALCSLFGYSCSNNYNVEIDSGNKLQNDNLPIKHSTALYPGYTFDELARKADLVIYARVVSVEETILDMDIFLMTPVVLEIIEIYKGNAEHQFTFFRDGGRTDTYIEKSSTYELTPDMEAIFFLTSRGYGFGPFTTWPIANNMVVLDWDAFLRLSIHDINIKEENLNEYEIAKLIDTPESFNTCLLNDFIALLSSLTQD